MIAKKNRIMPGFNHYVICDLLTKLRRGTICKKLVKEICEEQGCEFKEDNGDFYIISPSKTQRIGVKK